MNARTYENPSGKGAGDENFPVGSILLPKRLRPHVAVYYAFARAIDDVADSPDLDAEDKIRRLDAFEAAILGEDRETPGLEKAHALRRSLEDLGVEAARATDLISAFKQDAVKTRYENWAELMDYCRRSADPVGRFLLDIHGEDPAGYANSDALCSALQVLNHLQDLKGDYLNLDRVYLPQDWLAEAGASVEDLKGDQLTPALRQVVDRCLEATAPLNAKARGLPSRLKSRHLAMESAVIVKIAERLADELSRRDPLAERVVLSKPALAGCTARGVLGVLVQRLGFGSAETP